jgi:glycine cleavage system H protein
VTRHYTADHEWIAIAQDIATVGITHHAQQALGDVVFVSLPFQGQKVAKGDVVAAVESVKSASDVFAPLTGTVVENNQAALTDPALINADPLGEGWLFKLRVAAPGEVASLLSEAHYEATLR